MKLKLIDDWKKAHRLWSMRLNLIASAIVAYVLAAPEVMLGVLNSLPPEMRSLFPPFAGFALFALVTLARLAKQKEKPDERR